MKSIEQLVNESLSNRVLITGGAGSLGKAFVRLLKGSHEVVVIDSNEWALAELQKEYPEVECHLMDFKDWKFEQIPVDYIIHLAAYKHINLGEENVETFIENNLTKTRQLFEEAFRYNVDLLFMSTDKAVEPISVYGYTKAIGEALAEGYGFSVARCGNILSSSGSVIPTWENAIENKQPIPITDDRMTRWFIEDFDAANQMWDMFRNGEQLIIPKCQEVRIMDLLKMVLKRHGYERPDDYEPGVYVTGIRGKEKLREKLEW